MSKPKQRPFGKTGLMVSEVSFGGASISGEGKGYGFGAISDGEAVELVQAAYYAGINCFDTAPIYGFGLSEKRIGRAVKDFREKVLLVTKSGVSWHKDTKRVNRTNCPIQTEIMLEQSLKDLQTDYIDLYMIHWPDEKVDIRQPMEVLSKAKTDGKIKFIGLCNTNLDDLEKASEIDTIDVLQSSLNFFEREVEEDLFPEIKKQGLGFMSYGTLDKGILTGRVTKDRKFDEFDARSWAPWWKKSPVEEKVKKYIHL